MSALQFHQSRGLQLTVPFLARWSESKLRKFVTSSSSSSSTRFFKPDHGRLPLASIVKENREEGRQLLLERALKSRMCKDRITAKDIQANPRTPTIMGREAQPYRLTEQQHLIYFLVSLYWTQISGVMQHQLLPPFSNCCVRGRSLCRS